MPKAVDLKDPSVLVKELTKLADYATDFFLKIVIALMLLYVGFKIIKYVVTGMKGIFDKARMDETVSGFLVSLLSIIMKIVIILSLASMVGLPTASFIAILGSAGLAIGLAFQGSLANFAGGIIILILKPFQVGDYIREDARGNEGTVKSIDIFYTKLITPDNRKVIVPNAILTNNSLTNISKEPIRRLDLIISVAYTEEIYKVRETLNSILESNNLILADRDRDVIVGDLTPHMINFIIRVWVNRENYLTLKSQLLERIKTEFDKNNISVPMTQVYLASTNGNKI